MMFLRRATSFASKVDPNFHFSARSFGSKVSTWVLDKETKSGVVDSYPTNLPLSLVEARPAGGFDIQLVDDDSWRLSSGLARAWHEDKRTSLSEEDVVRDSDYARSLVGVDKDPDFDDIDGMRIRGNLFYKIDRGSKEYEEYSFEFHRRKKRTEGPIIGHPKEKESPRKQNDPKERPSHRPARTEPAENEEEKKNKKKRTPTFNQLTEAYHKPFCLDVQVSKSSVRACVVHRATSKVVAVAHSISKDMKFDLSSTRDAAACAAVGSVLARRALADDVHDVVYTPRRGERLEGKLELVIRSVMDNGINVDVKIKQRKSSKKPSFFPNQPVP